MGRPTGRPRPVCRPGVWQKRPASVPAQTGVQAGRWPEPTGRGAGPGRALGRASARGLRPFGRPRLGARPAHGHSEAAVTAGERRRARGEGERVRLHWRLTTGKMVRSGWPEGGSRRRIRSRRSSSSSGDVADGAVDSWRLRSIPVAEVERTTRRT